MLNVFWNATSWARLLWYQTRRGSTLLSSTHAAHPGRVQRRVHLAEIRPVGEAVVVDLLLAERLADALHVGDGVGRLHVAEQGAVFELRAVRGVALRTRDPAGARSSSSSGRTAAGRRGRSSVAGQLRDARRRRRAGRNRSSRRRRRRRSARICRAPTGRSPDPPWPPGLTIMMP